MADPQPWQIHQKQNGGGWVLTYEGDPWPMSPRPTEQAARAYLERVKGRYRGGSPRILIEPADEEQNGRSRGGPWRWTTPQGATTVEEYGHTGVIHTRRLEDAKSALRRTMDRKRLPNGIEWEIAEDVT